jgi:ABC-type nitrate/sulfonate/bicarbonate transport system substrate-binding protein
MQEGTNTLRRRAVVGGMLMGGMIMGSSVNAQRNTRLDLAASNTWWGQVPLMVAIEKGFFRDRRLRRIQ